MSSPERTVLLAGSTGLVGGHCLHHLLSASAPSATRVVSLVRRAPPTTDPRVTPLVADFAALDRLAPVAASVALCALGTTIKKAGSKDAFRAVDFDAVVAFARWARRGGATVFGLVSSVGADARAGTFYLQVKGEAEDAVAALGFTSFVALRPSVLLGARSEARPGEQIAQALMPIVNPLLVGGASRYRAIRAEQVGAALAGLVEQAPPGRVVWHHAELVAADVARLAPSPLTPSPGGSMPLA